MSRRCPLAVIVACVAVLPSLAYAQTPPAAVPATGQLKPGDLLAVCGDSITEQHLYSAYMEAYLVACKPVEGVRAEQFGWGGETAQGFKEKMPQFMVPFGATAATTCYGMNDGHYAPMSDKTGDWYRQNTTAVVEGLKKAGVRYIVVGTPGAVDTYTFHHKPQDAEVYNKTLAALGEIDRDVAQKEGVAFADVHGTMLDAMAKAKAKYGEKYPVAGAGDGIHPGPNGHLVMAYAFLKAMNLPGDIGTVSFDGVTQQATATAGHTVQSCSAGVIQMESTRYPFCFTGEASKPDSTAGMVEFVPFNQDLNRFKLVAINVGSPRVKVTFGDQSKEFAAADLAQGINLSAEFLDNPFSKPFADVLAKVKAQQDRETQLDKNFYNSIPAMEQQMPEAKAELAAMEKPIRDLIAAQTKAVAATVVPVRYTIRVEPVMAAGGK